VNDEQPQKPEDDLRHWAALIVAAITAVLLLIVLVVCSTRGPEDVVRVDLRPAPVINQEHHRLLSDFAAELLDAETRIAQTSAPCTPVEQIDQRRRPRLRESEAVEVEPVAPLCSGSGARKPRR
jgi:hypothetical protein